MGVLLIQTEKREKMIRLLFFSLLALQGSITSAHQVPAVSSVTHTALYTPPPEIPTTVLNIPHPSVIFSPLLKSLHSAGPPLLAVSAAPPAQPLAKVQIRGFLWDNGESKLE